MKGDARIPMGSRALGILTALVESSGRTVSKNALLARVSPNTFVVESNLKVTVAALRKSLGEVSNAPISLAHLRCDAGRDREAAAALAPVVARVVDGAGTRDFDEAKDLLLQLSGHKRQQCSSWVIPRDLYIGPRRDTIKQQG